MGMGGCVIELWERSYCSVPISAIDLAELTKTLWLDREMFDYLTTVLESQNDLRFKVEHGKPEWLASAER